MKGTTMKTIFALRLTLVSIVVTLLLTMGYGQRVGKVIRTRIGMEFVYVPAGTFMMGSSDADVQAVYENYKRYFPNAKLEQVTTGVKPQHRVDVRQGFYIGRYEVTISEWKAVMRDLPEGMKTYLADRFKMSDRQPVVRVSWNDAQAFIAKLNAMTDGYVYRLPSEAEWEYAARAGTTGGPGDLDSTAWYGNNSGKAPLDSLAILSTDASNYGTRLDENENRTHEVGGKHPNGFGLYDMYGNVWEWCEDWYHTTYDGAPTDGSAWISGGEQKYRVLRGGSWYAKTNRVGPTIRDFRTPVDRAPVPHVGFRLVAVART
jgi:formylglycine-generating enzyme required for sulfatase activity